MHIKVCFTKAGFMSQGVIEIDSDSEEKTRIAELVSLSLITLKITFDDFVKIDDNVITTQEITDQDNVNECIQFVLLSDENMNDNDRDVDEDNIDNVEEQVDENQTKNCILKFEQYVQQVDKVSDSIIKYLNETDNLLIKMPTTINKNKSLQHLITLLVTLYVTECLHNLVSCYSTIFVKYFVY